MDSFDGVGPPGLSLDRIRSHAPVGRGSSLFCAPNDWECLPPGCSLAFVPLYEHSRESLCWLHGCFPRSRRSAFRTQQRRPILLAHGLRLSPSELGLVLRASWVGKHLYPRSVVCAGNLPLPGPVSRLP